MCRHAQLPGLILLIGAGFCIPPTHAATCPAVSVRERVSYPVGTGPVEVAAGDFTGDGVLDLALTQSNYPVGPGSIQVLPGHAVGGIPDGTFEGPITTPLGGIPLGLVAADLDHDGHLDLIVGNWGSNAVQVLRGLGAGTFATPLLLPAGAQPYEIVTGDFNSDGVTDIAAADNAQNSVQVLIAGKNPGTGAWDGTFAAAVAYATSNLPLSIAAGDFTSDGITDLVCTESFNSTVALFIGAGSGGVGNGTFLPALHVPAGLEPYDIGTGDFNADGRLDLVVVSGALDGVRVLLGTGTGFFPVVTSYLVGSTCTGVAVADFDQDGIDDIAVTNSSAFGATNQMSVLRGLGSGGAGNGTFDTPVSYDNCCTPVHPITADVDGNGRADVVSCEYTSNGVAVFLDGCSTPAGPPAIVRIRDVPNDEGGKVFMTWTRSSFDIPGGAVNAYRVWRQVPPEAVVSLSLTAGGDLPADIRRQVVTHADGTTDLVFWEALATLPAQRLAGYGYTAATPQDSILGSNPRFTFYVSALTSNIDRFYDSAPDSGYSVDNLSPAAPSGLLVARSGGAAQLDWAPSNAADFAMFRIYRSYDPAFVPSASTLLATLTTPSYHDPEGMTASYRIAAVDAHGNASPYTSSIMATTGVGPAGVPLTTALAAPRPNPVRGVLDVRLSLAHASYVSLAVYDQFGRRVRGLLEESRPAGDIRLRWDTRDDAGHRVAPGVFFLRMRADGREQVRQLSVMR